MEGGKSAETASGPAASGGSGGGAPPPLGVGVFGATGRVGQLLAQCIAREPGRFALVAGFARQSGAAGGGGSGCCGGQAAAPIYASPADLPAELLPRLHVLIDFSRPEGTRAAAVLARQLRVPLVVGTTGLDTEIRATLRAAAAAVPVFVDANFARGVHVLKTVAAFARRALPAAYGCEIVETHHRRKVDAPSGTAKALAEAVGGAANDAGGAGAAADGGGVPAAPAAGSGGAAAAPGAPAVPSPPIHALRLGGVVGTHTVIFADDFELIELTHRALDRTVFAAGALNAAEWLARPGRGPGYFTMDDMVAAEMEGRTLGTEELSV